MAGISEEMRRKMRVDRQKGHVQAGNASWKGTVQGRGSAWHMIWETSGCSRDVLSSLTQEGSFLTADISFETAAVVYAQKNAARRRILFFFYNLDHILSAQWIPLIVNLTTYYSQQMSLPGYDIEDPSDGDAGQGAVISPQPWVNVFVRSCQSESCITRQTGVKFIIQRHKCQIWVNKHNLYGIIWENMPRIIHHDSAVLSVSLPCILSRHYAYFCANEESFFFFFTRQDASSRAQHGMITDSRWGKQQGQKDETSCPRTVAAVHLANTNWHRQEELPVEKKHLCLLAFEIMIS